MQASLCLQAARPAVKSRHRPLSLPPASSVILRRGHCQPCQKKFQSSCKALRAGPIRIPIIPAMCARVTPPGDDIDKNKAVEAKRGRAKSAAAAAVVLACTLAAMCTGWQATSKTAGWCGTGQEITSDCAPSPSSIGCPSPMQDEDDTIIKKSIQALKEIFDWKSFSRMQKPAKTPKVLLEILDDGLRDEKSKLQKYIDQLKNEENPEAVTDSLYDEWMKMPECPETYDLGLVLIDLLINLGDYKRANTVCQRIESIAPPLDKRPQIRRAILDVMLVADEIQSKVDTAKTRMLKRRVESLVQSTLGVMFRAYRTSRKRLKDVKELADDIESDLDPEKIRTLKTNAESLVSKLLEIAGENNGPPC